MSGKYSFYLKSDDPSRQLPGKVIMGLADTETIFHVGLKLVAYIYYYRERLQIETRVPNDAIQFVPDLVQLDYQLRPKLWIECGECGISKLNKLAVKAPEAEICVVKKSFAAGEELLRMMEKEKLRRGRYQILALEYEPFAEMCGLAADRNQVYWFKAIPEEQVMQLEFNGLWFELGYSLHNF